eukprot:TRINITY_DN70390_c0_g1_i1.p2 TRINITY_DN70390_c0_g1~~TRINITY_DN70390_c0_g1_i1.p2  ORF type:complete len:229 (-),score=60.55 TRINITY_DN70390_c0_g1_i1:35-721(-)
MAHVDPLQREAKLEQLGPDELERDIEEMELESDIRALEIEEALARLQTQLEIQREHVEAWQKAMAKAKHLPGSARQDLERAQEEVASLETQCRVLRAQRPMKIAIPRARDEEDSPSASSPAEAKADEAASAAPGRPAGGGLARRAAAKVASKRPPSGGDAKKKAAPKVRNSALEDGLGPVELARRTAARNAPAVRRSSGAYPEAANGASKQPPTAPSRPSEVRQPKKA